MLVFDVVAFVNTTCLTVILMLRLFSLVGFNIGFCWVRRGLGLIVCYCLLCFGWWMIIVLYCCVWFLLFAGVLLLLLVLFCCYDGCCLVVLDLIVCVLGLIVVC